MDKLKKILLKHFSHQDITLSNTKNLKKIVAHLNKKWIIIVSWILWVSTLSLMKDMVIKTKMQDSFFYFNWDLDFNHKISNQKDLEKFYNDEKIIILENIDAIDKAEDFIHTQFKNGKKIILLGNALHIKWVHEIEILPNSSSYDNVSLLTHKVITKDIYIKQKLKNFSLLEHTIQTLAQNRKLISVREIHKILTSEWSKISQITLIEYINYILDSKLIKKVLRYDMKSNNVSTGKAKYFFTDTSMRTSTVNNSLSSQITSENNIFQKLERLWYKIFTGKNWTFNFTFITNKELSKQQLSESKTPKTLETKNELIIHVSKHLEKNEIKKEAKKLLKIPGKYSKYLIVKSIKDIWIRPSTYLPVKIMEIDEFLNLQKK